MAGLASGRCLTEEMVMFLGRTGFSWGHSQHLWLFSPQRLHALSAHLWLFSLLEIPFSQTTLYLKSGLLLTGGQLGPAGGFLGTLAWAIGRRERGLVQLEEPDCCCW